MSSYTPTRLKAQRADSPEYTLLLHTIETSSPPYEPLISLLDHYKLNQPSFNLNLITSSLNGNTLLHRSNNDIYIIRILLHYNASTLCYNEELLTPLHTCQNVSQFRLLLSYTPTFYNDIQLHQQRIPLLSYHVKYNRYDIIQLLINRKANINIYDCKMLQSIHYAQSYDVAKYLLDNKAYVQYSNKLCTQPLHIVTDYDIAQLLLEYKALPHYTNRSLQNALHTVQDPLIAQLYLDCYTSDTTTTASNPTVTPLSSSSPSSPSSSSQSSPPPSPKSSPHTSPSSLLSATTISGLTPLHMAINGPMTAFLLHNKCDINIQSFRPPNGHYETPLHRVTTYDKVRILLDAGADYTIRNSDNETPLQRQFNNRHYDGVGNQYSLYGFVEYGLTLLSPSQSSSPPSHNNNSDILTIDRQKASPLAESISLCLDYGILDPNMKCKTTFSKETALLLHLSDVKAFRLLLECNANPNIYDCDKRTPLFYAIDEAIVKVLIEYKADINSTDINGLRPIQYNTYPSALLGLLEAKADPDFIYTEYLWNHGASDNVELLSWMIRHNYDIPSINIGQFSVLNKIENKDISRILINILTPLVAIRLDSGKINNTIKDSAWCYYLLQYGASPLQRVYNDMLPIETYLPPRGHLYARYCDDHTKRIISLLQDSMGYIHDGTVKKVDE